MGKFVMSLSDKVFYFHQTLHHPQQSPSSDWCAFVNMPSETWGFRRHLLALLIFSE
ncbi:hypothetical protein I7Q09_06135 [Neisseria meningitidis]|nr:hypothetical protein [Neisseria meningitidis]